MNNDILHIAFIGMGYRGKQLLSLIRHISGYHVTAIADPEAREEDYGVPCYNRGGEDYRRMIKEQAPQLVSLPLRGCFMSHMPYTAFKKGAT